MLATNACDAATACHWQVREQRANPAACVLEGCGRLPVRQRHNCSNIPPRCGMQFVHSVMHAVCPQRHACSLSTASCMQFVHSVADFAEGAAESQENASFALGDVVRGNNTAAVYWHSAAFSAFPGGNTRFEVTNSTMFCGSEWQAEFKVAQRAYSESVGQPPVLVAVSESDGGRSWVVPTVITVGACRRLSPLGAPVATRRAVTGQTCSVAGAGSRGGDGCGGLVPPAAAATCAAAPGGQGGAAGQR
jgi:hypothetical protein